MKKQFQDHEGLDPKDRLVFTMIVVAVGTAMILFLIMIILVFMLYQSVNHAV